MINQILGIFMNTLWIVYVIMCVLSLLVERWGLAIYWFGALTIQVGLIVGMK